MELVEDRTILGETLVVDGKAFRNCTLVNCILEYSGGEMVFDRTYLRGCKYSFFGPARGTVHFLQSVGLLPCDPVEWGEFPNRVH